MKWSSCFDDVIVSVLLIEPEGIEIIFIVLIYNVLCLLIEPEGIEIEQVPGLGSQ